jgi:sodium-dependent dicarboxylate transporter 2/3/5
MSTSQRIGFWVGIAICLLFVFMPTPNGMSVEAKRAVGVTLLMAIWWLSEAIPIYATAFVPMALFPLLGVLETSDVAESYGHSYVIMLLCGFFIAKVIESQQLHKRIALIVLKKLGSNQQRIILSFMIVSAFLSMWIANVAVVLLMLPIATAVISKTDEADETSQFGLALMLSTAYACSIGGTATLIGTPVNMVFAGIVGELFPAAPEINFFTWIKIGFPIVVLFIPLIWFYIIKYFKITNTVQFDRATFSDELATLGKMSDGEKKAFAVFLFTALGWIFRSDFDFGSFRIQGWGSLLGVADYVHDSTVAVVGALFLFALTNKQTGKPLLTWKEASSVPWGIVMIVGGGYAIARSFQKTGLAEWIGGQMNFIGDYSPLIILLIVTTFIIFLTEVNSNTATANIFLPVLAAVAVAASINPLFLMIPATFACSFAFMMPSGTGTNTVIFASGKVTIPEMAKCGLGLNLMSIILLTALLYFVIIPILGLEMTLPAWVR